MGNDNRLIAYYNGERLDQHETPVQLHAQQTVEQHHNHIYLHSHFRVKLSSV